MKLYTSEKDILMVNFRNKSIIEENNMELL